LIFCLYNILLKDGQGTDNRPLSIISPVIISHR